MNYHPDEREREAWIDAGYLFDPLEDVANAMDGVLYLTEPGRIAAGFAPTVKPVTQREMF